MENVTVPARKYLMIPAMGIMAFAFQTTAGTGSIAPMIACAAMVHMAAMTLRDAEFRALTQDRGLNLQDILAYGASVLFDALLLFALVVGAGVLMAWDRFLDIALIVTVLMPVPIYFLTRKHLDPATARPGIRAPHLTALLLVVVLAVTYWKVSAFQVPSGNQPFIWLVLLSAINAAMDPATRFAGTARTLRFGILAGILALLLWNYIGMS